MMVGDNGMKEYETRTTKGSKNKTPTNVRPHLEDKFRIYFPSHDTVARSRGGINVSSTYQA